MDLNSNQWTLKHPSSSNLLVCIDDVHPEFIYGHDFGSLKETSGLLRIIGLANEFSWIKFIIFLVPNWRYRGKTKCWPDEKFSIINNPGWCEKLKELLPPNMAIGLHGFDHYNSSHFEKWKEFYELSPDEIRFRLESMLNAFEKANLPYRKIFRPPGWEFPDQALGLLPEFGIYHFAGTYDIKTAISKDAISDQFGIRGTPLTFLSESGGITSIPANFDIGWSSDFRITDLLTLNGFICMNGHITNRCYEYFIGNGPELNIISRLRQNLRTLTLIYANGKIMSTWPDIEQ